MKFQILILLLLSGCEKHYNVVMEYVGGKPWFYCSKSEGFDNYQVLMRSDNVKEVNDYCEKMRAALK